MRIFLPFLALSLPLLLLPGCESTQSKSAKLARGAKGSLQERAHTVGRQNPNVRILSSTALQDSNGTAVVVRMRNTGHNRLARLPIAIDVKGGGGKSLFKNDAPGLAESLRQVPLLVPGKEFLWVNDQVTAAARPNRVEARVGDSNAHAAANASVPRIGFAQVKLRQDPVDGPEAVGIAVNRSGVDERKLVIFGVVRNGGRIVAAGRAQITRLKPHKRTRFQLFFIGNPLGGKLQLAAPPTVLR